MERVALPTLRIGLGVIFVWFGALKFIPGLSPAEGLIEETVCWAVDPAWFIPVLATWECTIGLALLANRGMRLALVLLALHMGGTFMPMVTCPDKVWTSFPFVWTLEGQYILKNLVLIGAGFSLCASLCGSRVVAATRAPAHDDEADRRRGREPARATHVT